MALQDAATNFCKALQHAITTATYDGKQYENGAKAKEALIRSQSLIQIFHEALKIMINQRLCDKNDSILSQFDWTVTPQVGRTSPELKIFGALKAKDQDITFTRMPFQAEEKDQVGFEASNSAIICGVRSQMSSIEKNFDTLMERAIAEAVNLNYRFPQVTLVELYVIPLQELHTPSALKNEYHTQPKNINIGKFINQFYSTTYNGIEAKKEYMVDACCLLIIDLNNHGRIIENIDDLIRLGASKEICNKFQLLAPDNFIDRIIARYKANNNLQ